MALYSPHIVAAKIAMENIGGAAFKTARELAEFGFLISKEGLVAASEQKGGTIIRKKLIELVVERYAILKDSEKLVTMLEKQTASYLRESYKAGGGKRPPATPATHHPQPQPGLGAPKPLP